MTCSNYKFLPEINLNNIEDESEKNEVVGDSPCPCCGYVTIPNKGDALAYICPICMWEIDLFIHDENEPSDLNHGLSLKKARKNYKKLENKKLITEVEELKNRINHLECRLKENNYR